MNQPMKWTIVVIVFGYLASIVARMLAGIPGQLSVELLLILNPVVVVAYALSQSLSGLERRFGARQTLAIGAAAMLYGLVLCYFYFYLMNVWMLGALLLALIVGLCRTDATLLKRMAVCTAVVFSGFGLVFNLTVLAAQATAGRLNDALAWDIDRAVYEFFLGQPVPAADFFPLVRSPIFFELLHNSYLILYVEIVIVILILVERQGDLAAFFWVFFGCYLGGLLIYVLYPVFQPLHHVPECFRADFRETVCFDMMNSLSEEYRSLTGAGSGRLLYCYYIGLPSMHVCVVLVLQTFLRISAWHFWFFLPINVLMVLATFLLGFHYLIDVVGGALLAAILLGMLWWRQRSRPMPSAEAGDG